MYKLLAGVLLSLFSVSALADSFSSSLSFNQTTPVAVTFDNSKCPTLTGSMQYLGRLYAYERRETNGQTHLTFFPVGLALQYVTGLSSAVYSSDSVVRDVLQAGQSTGTVNFLYSSADGSISITLNVNYTLSYNSEAGDSLSISSASAACK